MIIVLISQATRLFLYHVFIPLVREEAREQNSPFSHL